MHHKSQLSDYEPVGRRGRSSGDLIFRPDAPCSPEMPTSAAYDHTPGAQETGAPSSSMSVARRASGRAGHHLSFIGLVLFTFVLFFRPYEFSPSLMWLDRSAFWTGLATVIIFLITQVATEGRLTVPQREVNILLLLVAIALLSIPLAIDPSLSWDTFKEFIKPVLMFIVLVNTVRTERRLWILFLLTLSVSCFISGGALRDFALGKLTGDRVMGVVGNLFDNPNTLALHLVTVIPIGAALSLSANNVLKKAIYAAAVLLMVGGVTVSFSRGGFLGLLCSAGFLGWKLRKKHPTLILILGVLSLLLFVILIPSGYGTRLASIFNAGLDLTGSASQRQQLLWRSIIVAIRHPLLGIGIGNFPIMGIQLLSTHNAYTQVASEMGMTAMVLYVMFMIVPFKRLARIERATDNRVKRETRFHYLAIGLQASLLGYMVSSFFAHVAYTWYIYYLVGYAVSLGRIFDAYEASPLKAEAKGLEAKAVGAQT